MKIIRPERIRRPQQADILFIPSEITYCIFLICYEHNPRAFPTAISQTCYHWREFALTCPILWSQIVFNKNVHDARVADMYRIQLARSGEAPLNIRISGFAVRKPAIKNLRTIAELIVPHVDRWASLEIEPNVPHKAVRVFFDKLRDARAPRLETLVIHQRWFTWDRDKKIKWRFKAFGGGTPQLKQLGLTRAKVDWRSNIFNTLEKLDVRDPNLRGKDPIQVASIIRDVLARAPKLRSLSVQDYIRGGGLSWGRGPLPLTPDPFTHSSIETLELLLHGGTVMDYILHSIRMPSLRSLPDKYAILPSSFYQIARSNPLSQLQKLQIHSSNGGIPLQEHERQSLPVVLRSMQALRALYIRRVDLTGSDSWLPELLIWCPSLTVLHLAHCEGVEKRALKEMVERRRQAKGLMLQTLLIMGGNGASDDFWRLVEEGEIMDWIRLRVERLVVG